MFDFLTGSDAFIWSIGADPRLRPTIVTLTLLEEPPDWTALVERFGALTAAVPAFRRCVVASPAPLPPRWVDDPDFDLAFHLRRVTAPTPGTLDTLLDIARLAAMADFDRARPLWEVTVIEGLADGRAAMLCRLHHCISDGTGAVAMAAHLFDRVANQSSAVTTARRPEQRPAVARIGDALTHPLRAFGAVCADGAAVLHTAVPTGGPRSPIMTGRSKSRRLAVHSVSEADLRSAGHAAGGSLNDAFLAAVAGGLQVYHNRHGAPLDEALLMMPISIRGPEDAAGGNRTMLMRFDVPVRADQAAERIEEIHRRSRRVRKDRALNYVPHIAAALALAPRWYVSATLRTVDLIASDVPGMATRVSLAGAAVQMQWAFSPTMGAAVNVTLVSYAGQCAVGINADNAAIPDVDVFRECLAGGFDDVLVLGRSPVGHC